MGVLQPHHKPQRICARAQPTIEGKLRVSIVTPSLNQGRFLEAAIRSVESQNYRPVEHIVIDGASSDSTIEILREHQREGFRWISERDNGQADALNKGFHLAQGEVLAYLNSDDIILEGAIAAVVDAFERNPEVDVVYGNRLLLNENGEAIGAWINPRHTALAYKHFDFIAQETMYWRRHAWVNSGGHFRSDLHFALDWDLIRRFAAAGLRLMHIPRFLGGFRVHAEQKSHSKNRAAFEIESTRLLGGGWRSRRWWRLLNTTPYMLQQRIAETIGRPSYERMLDLRP